VSLIGRSDDQDLTCYTDARAYLPGGAVVSSGHVNSILCAADPGGSIAMLERLVLAADQHNVDAVAIVGNLDDRGENYRGVFHALGRAGCPVFWVPGPADAPVEHHLQEAFNVETAVDRPAQPAAARLDRRRSGARIAPAASRSFEEPGAPEGVAALAREWFLRHVSK
jgi:calcineurin superfamily metallophosphoesterase